ncbi:conserved hypothetical protein [Ricinus communis]|uniref:Uncharacterized protein n=1 Tax=Ricinus communis TaxID=3988 RepID=B9SFQ0_RICCO|nr:conserved hypothetical protein [Ricinus communis]
MADQKARVPGVLCDFLDYNTPWLAQLVTHQAFQQHDELPPRVRGYVADVGFSQEMTVTPLDYTALIGLRCDDDPSVFEYRFRQSMSGLADLLGFILTVKRQMKVVLTHCTLIGLGELTLMSNH